MDPSVFIKTKVQWHQPLEDPVFVNFSLDLKRGGLHGLTPYHKHYSICSVGFVICEGLWRAPWSWDWGPSSAGSSMPQVWRMKPCSMLGFLLWVLYSTKWPLLDISHVLKKIVVISRVVCVQSLGKTAFVSFITKALPTFKSLRTVRWAAPFISFFQ